MKNILFLFVTLFFIGITQAQINPPVVKIGNQTWMVKNLDVDHYRNGDPIPEVEDSATWAKLTTGAWCYNRNDPETGKKFGKLYNWYAVNDPRGLAPKGWHIPKDADWLRLIKTLGGKDTAGSKMKSTTDWPYNNGTNSSGFTGLPGGYRFGNGMFYQIGVVCFWWSSSMGISNNAWSYSLNSYFDIITRTQYRKQYGMSVRCIKD